MARQFRISGPCDPKKHYMIDAERRLGEDVMYYIDNELYFLIHAARQSGKTTLLFELQRRLNDSGRYYALYCSLEKAETADVPERGIPVIMDAIRLKLKYSGIPGKEKFGAGFEGSSTENVLQDALTDFCHSLDKPLVVLFDEVDCLSGKTLISFLRQLRDGYVSRTSGTPFIHSLAIVGMRNIRDYRDEYRDPSKSLGSASPFNVIEAYMTLKNFSHEEIVELYGQHTSETGQEFLPEAVGLVYEQTQGQPWLVNAIAKTAVKSTCDFGGNSTGEPITADMVTEAINRLILERGTHFDSLMARLKDERVKRVLQPVITGEVGGETRFSDDFSYVKDMGLIRNNRGSIEISNPIYTEVITRALNWDVQESLVQSGAPYEVPKYYKNNTIDMDALLKDFQEFWRENGAMWEEKFDYREAAPHLILMAFLQRVINGGGTINREFAAETGRTDICVGYKGKKYPVEIKILRHNKTRADGIRQLSGYMNSLGAKKGWLVIFDRDKDKSWEDKLYFEHEEQPGSEISVVGC